MNEFRRCRLGYDANKYRIFGDSSVKFKETAEVRQQMLEYRYDALCSQMNPHFLFNTLNILYAMEGLDAEASQRVILKVSSMFHYILEHHEQTKAQLSDELQFVEQYMYILAIRYSNHLHVTYVGEPPSEKNFEVQNNDFGWTHLPFSTMEDNTVFLPFTAMLKNFYQYLLAKDSEIFLSVDMKCRLKRFVFAFIVVPAKWVRVARQWTLNIYTKDRWLHYRTIFNASYG